MSINNPAKLLLRTPIFRMSYPNYVKPKAFNDGKRKGDPMYGGEMLLEPENLEKFLVRRDNEWEEIDVRNAMAEVAKGEWPDINLREAVANRGLGWPLVDGDKKADEREARKKKGDAYRGVKVIPVKSKEEYPPQLYVVDSGKWRELDRNDDADRKRAESLFVAGFYARANVSVQARETPQGKFICFYVNAVAFIKEGERIGGMSGEDRFGGIEGGMADHDPTEGLDDDIPF